MTTVQDAGRKGGLATARSHDHDFFVKIGKKGGKRIKALIEAGKQSLGE